MWVKFTHSRVIYVGKDMRMEIIYQMLKVKKFNMKIFKSAIHIPTPKIQVGRIIQISNGATVKPLILIKEFNKLLKNLNENPHL